GRWSGRRVLQVLEEPRRGDEQVAGRDGGSAPGFFDRGELGNLPNHVDLTDPQWLEVRCLRHSPPVRLVRPAFWTALGGLIWTSPFACVTVEVGRASLVGEDRQGCVVVATEEKPGRAFVGEST